MLHNKKTNNIITYKKTLLTIVCLITAFAFSSCKKDDPVQDFLEGLKENQMLMDGKVVDVTCTLGIRPAGKGWEGDPGAYYFDVTPVDKNATWHGRYDLGLPLVGKTIDLANPTKDIDEYQFSVYFEKGEDYLNMQNIFGLEGGQGFIEDKELSGSCFKSGSFVTNHDKQGFHHTFVGELTNGKTLALRALVPEDEIMYW